MRLLTQSALGAVRVVVVLVSGVVVIMGFIQARFVGTLRRGRSLRAIILSLFLLMALHPAARGELVWETLSNGHVFDNPTYPYLGHGYEFDSTVGDNDMPWLREYAAMRGIFADVNMSLDWKEREWDMMRAIVHFTANNFHWDGVSSITAQQYRALTIIALNDVFGEMTLWGCGDVSAAAMGLAQAHGIPARMINGVTNELNADICLEMFSTRYNRWIHFFPKGDNWIEHETLGPLGGRELNEYDVAGMIQVAWIDDVYQAVPNPPLMFMPGPVNQAPISPFFYEHWWSGYFRHFMVSTKTRPNKSFPEPATFLFVCNDDFINNAYNSAHPIMPMSDLNVTYPLNNVEASVLGKDTRVFFHLKNNMTEFVRYEARVNDGPWGSFENVGIEPTGNPDEYSWIAELIPSVLLIRGVNLANAHSPDVVLRVSQAADLIVDGKIDGMDIAEFVRIYLESDPLSPPWYLDFNMDGVLDGADVAEFAEQVLTGS